MLSSKSKKFVAIICTFCLVFAICIVNASGEGINGVVGELTSGLSATNIWGAILPIMGLVIIVTLVALARRVLNKNLKSTKNGGSGKV